MWSKCKRNQATLVYLPSTQRVQSLKRLYPLGREKNWKPFSPQETTGPWHGKQGKDFSLIPSVSTYLPIPGSYKCQSSQPRDKHLCVGTSQSQIISQHLCPAAAPLEMCHRACTPRDHLPFPSSEVTKGYCPFLTLDFTERRKRWGEKKKICFLTSCKLKRKQKKRTWPSAVHSLECIKHTERNTWAQDCLQQSVQSTSCYQILTVKWSKTLPLGVTSNLAP